MSRLHRAGRRLRQAVAAGRPNPYARPVRARHTPASLYTHVIRFCGKIDCRGHRVPKATPAVSG